MGVTDRTPVTDVAAVERELDELWREASSGDQAVLRACTMNLIVACRGVEDLPQATRAVESLSRNHPGRALVVAPRREAGDAGELLVSVSAHRHCGSGGALVFSEQVTLEPAHEGKRLVRGSLPGLLAGDCPVFVWWLRPTLAGDPLFRPLTDLADVFIADTAAADDPAAALAELSDVASERSNKCSVGDLAWDRLVGWREALASLFDPSWTLPYLADVEQVKIVFGPRGSSGQLPVSCAYLAGWLVSRMGWRKTGTAAWARIDGGACDVSFDEDTELHEGEVGSVRLHTGAARGQATFGAARIVPGGKIVMLAAESADTCPLPYTHRVEPLDDIALLCGRMDRDPDGTVFIASLSAAARIAGSSA